MPRFAQHFEGIIDDLLENDVTTEIEHEPDTYDILRQQWKAQMEQQRQQAGDVDPLLAALQEQQGADEPKDVPAELYRRYQISIIPESSEVARKLREVRATDVGALVKVSTPSISRFNISHAFPFCWHRAVFVFT